MHLWVCTSKSIVSLRHVHVQKRCTKYTREEYHRRRFEFFVAIFVGGLPARDGTTGFPNCERSEDVCGTSETLNVEISGHEEDNGQLLEEKTQQHIKGTTFP